MPVETPVVPSAPAASSECTTQTTVTVTLPHPSGTGYVPSVPSGTGVMPSVVVPYPSAPYPSAPAGTGYMPAPPAGTASASGTGSPVKPTPTEYFTGAASHNVAGFVAGVGAFAALFL
jgi:hypothetical protein